MALFDWLFRSNPETDTNSPSEVPPTKFGSAEPLTATAPPRETFQHAKELPDGAFRFIALDVETACSDAASICQIGLACVEPDNRIRTFSMFVNPGTRFDPFNIQLHGIGPETVSDAPAFPDAFQSLLPLLNRHHLIQHSSFDKRAIAAACVSFGIPHPDLRWSDSVTIARKAWPELKGNGGHGLANLKKVLDLEFRHHDAGEDARAAAMVVLHAEARLAMTFEEIAGPVPKKRRPASVRPAREFSVGPTISNQDAIGNNDRKAHLDRFYALMEELHDRVISSRPMSETHGKMDWPGRGVYFLFEPGETRDNGISPRVTRVGTHALKSGAGTSLWNRVSQHRGNFRDRGGNHRGSVFRLLVGQSLINREYLDFKTWGQGSSAPRDVRQSEKSMEQRVSDCIGRMKLLALEVNDPPGPDSDRGYIERNAIALLSNFGKPETDPPSAQWLGLHCDRERVRLSGLWNNNHVDESYDPLFLNRLEELIAAQRAQR